VSTDTLQWIIIGTNSLGLVLAALPGVLRDRRTGPHPFRGTMMHGSDGRQYVSNRCGECGLHKRDHP
jgi:hypothetical protein